MYVKLEQYCHLQHSISYHQLCTIYVYRKTFFKVIDETFMLKERKRSTLKGTSQLHSTKICIGLLSAWQDS